MGYAEELSRRLHRPAHTGTGDQQIDASWNASTDGGSSAITLYRLQWRRPGVDRFDLGTVFVNLAADATAYLTYNPYLI